MTTHTDLEERYGRRSGARRTRIAWVVAGVVVALAVVAWFAWSTLTNPANALKADATAFHLSERAVTVEFQVSAPPGTPLACAIEALDEEHGVVGFAVVELEASDITVRAFAETVPTVAEATTGLVKSCWVT
ncbi:MAG: DUF4307 domain-containing protein [Microbacterium sp.]|uniref:DUF4307 domain-containing protein n=1 Tax=Microbacterium sp. TaxID=51671 RepID=UPI003A89E623